MHADLEKLLSANKINPQTAERLDTVSPGSFVLHKSWGAGKIQSWDLREKKLVIDFETKDGHEMDLKFALGSLDALDASHFRAQRFEQLDELRELAQNDPVELLRRTLESHEFSMRLDEVDEVISPVIVPEDGYKKWWDGAKKAMREDHRFVVPSKRSEPLQLRATDLSPAALLVSDYVEARDFKSKVKAMESIVTQSRRMKAEPEQLSTLYGLVDSDLETGANAHLQQVLELVVLRDDLAVLAEVPVPDDKTSLVSVVRANGAKMKDVLGGITGSRQAKIFEIFPEAFGDHWVEIAVDVFHHGGPRAVSEAAKFLVEQEKLKELKKHVRMTLSRHTTSADALIWICRERNKEAGELFDISVGTAILALLEKDHLDDGPMRNGRLRSLLVDDRDLIPDLIGDADKTDIKHFARRLLNSAAFPELDRKSLMARVIKAKPETQKLVSGQADPEEDDSLLVSWESLDRKKAELEDIVKNRIPQNTKEISIARSYGDLKENFEFKAAKDMQAVLMRRKGELERDVNLARGTDFKGADTTSVSIGTKVLVQNSDGDEVLYTVLGAWDSDPSQHLVSYKSEIGGILLDKVVDDEVEIVDLNSDQRRTYTIKKIEAVNP